MVARTVLEPETVMVPQTILVPQTVLRPRTVLTAMTTVSAATTLSSPASFHRAWCMSVQLSLRQQRVGAAVSLRHLGHDGLKSEAGISHRTAGGGNRGG